jgi:DNA-binding MarR family transcriptional regulator
MSIVVIVNYFRHTLINEQLGERYSMVTKKRINAGQAWERTLRAVSRLLREFDKEMQAEANVTVVWYDVLLNLHMAPDKRMRMQTLSDSLVLTRSGATRLVDRIEKAGLVRREPAAEDRRGYYAILTDQGQGALDRVQKVHSRDIKRLFGAHLDADEQQTLYTIMSKILAANS